MGRNVRIYIVVLVGLGVCLALLFAHFARPDEHPEHYNLEKLEYVGSPLNVPALYDGRVHFVEIGDDQMDVYRAFCSQDDACYPLRYGAYERLEQGASSDFSVRKEANGDVSVRDSEETYAALLREDANAAGLVSAPRPMQRTQDECCLFFADFLEKIEGVIA